MRLKGEAYSKRLEAYATSTLQLISDILGTDRETIYKMDEITTNSEYDEAEVVRRLEALRQSFSAKKKTQ